MRKKNDKLWTVTEQRDKNRSLEATLASDTSTPYSQGLGIVCSALGAIEGGIWVCNRNRKTTQGKDINPIMFLESMMCSPPLLSSPAERGIAVRCVVGLLWVNLVKVRPRVRHLQASCCWLKSLCAVGSVCPVIPQRQDTRRSPYCITPGQTRGPDPAGHLNTNERSSFNAALTGPKWRKRIPVREGCHQMAERYAEWKRLAGYLLFYCLHWLRGYF